MPTQVTGAYADVYEWENRNLYAHLHNGASGLVTTCVIIAR